MTSKEALAAQLSQEEELDLSAERKGLEEQYRKAANGYPLEGKTFFQVKFEYAWVLIKSRNESDIKTGVELFSELISQLVNVEDCYYYSAIAHFKLKDYKNARHSIMQLLSLVPHHVQGKSLLELIEDECQAERTADLQRVSLWALPVLAVATVALLAGKKR
eukprot:GFYU01005322.1.p1 GENE.GFYU01005322.1~~GFYU01005322.1.p1  ORF type:complete len:162 (+),score=12.51 GFYU01005322.1:288-773(+)